MQSIGLGLWGSIFFCFSKRPPHCNKVSHRIPPPWSDGTGPNGQWRGTFCPLPSMVEGQNVLKPIGALSFPELQFSRGELQVLISFCNSNPSIEPNVCSHSVQPNK